MRILFLYYFLFPFISQTQSLETGLADQFFKNKTVAWEKTYSGFWDETIPVQLDLVSDGENCKGYFYFGDNKTKYVLSGTIQNNKLKLDEQDLNSTLTGKFALEMDDQSVRGTWYNADRTYNASISLKEGSPAPATTFWVRSYASKSDPDECMVLIHKDFSDQIAEKFYYKMLNKTLYGTSEIKDDESFHQESNMVDYLQHNAGKLSTWKVNDKRIDINYKLGTIEYTKSLDLVNQVAISQESFADHWMAVDIAYPKIDKSGTSIWFKNLIDSFLVVIQEKKRILLSEKPADQSDRMVYRMSIWPQFDFLDDHFVSGIMQIKNSWEESIQSMPFTFDIKSGDLLGESALMTNVSGFRKFKDAWVNKELNKLKTGSSLDYKSLTVADFSILTLKKEGLSISAPYDLIYGFRQIIIPYSELKDHLSPKYFPL